MKTNYIQPTVSTVNLLGGSVMQAASPNQGIIINPNPGSGVDGD